MSTRTGKKSLPRYFIFSNGWWRLLRGPLRLKQRFCICALNFNYWNIWKCRKTPKTRYIVVSSFWVCLFFSITSTIAWNFEIRIWLFLSFKNWILIHKCMTGEPIRPSPSIFAHCKYFIMYRGIKLSPCTRTTMVQLPSHNSLVRRRSHLWSCSPHC